jgi:hypothetical protein
LEVAHVKHKKNEGSLVSNQNNIKNIIKLNLRKINLTNINN